MSSSRSVNLDDELVGDLAPPVASHHTHWEGVHEKLEGALRIIHHPDAPVLEYRGLVEPLASHPPTLRQRFLVRFLDILIVVPAIVVLLPVMFFVGMAVALTSPGPVIYRSRRITRQGEFFDMLKFRSMVTNGDEVLEAHFIMDPRARELYIRDMKLRADPRLTPVGRFIRKWSLDELPQLLNVLVGHMSIVGPRPLLHEEFVRFGGAVDTVVRVKGGLTGLWQVAGRNLLTFEERVPLDVRYARSRTMLGDIKIIGLTFVQLLRGSPGAF